MCEAGRLAAASEDGADAGTFWSQRRERFQNAGSVSNRSALAPLFCFTRAREYQTVLGFATDWLPPRRKAIAFAAPGVKR
jgi:hypothetical protein